jgi:alpha-glucosidase
LTQTRTISNLQKSGVIFEIYPRSFKAAGGGSQGDLKGIIEKLEYLEWLGIQQIWLPPIYPSPMRDGGYDVSDHYRIHSAFGTQQDFDDLVAAAEKRGIGIIMDLVVNHTSNEHEWFKEALISPRSPFRNRYIFRPGKPDGGLPNNHLSVFGGPAWEPVPGEDNTYFYHTFANSQPDLNYNHPAVQAEMKRIMRHWLDRGVRGIRVDAVHFVGKNVDLDEPQNADWNGGDSYLRLHHPHTQFQPFMFNFMDSLCEIAAEYDDRVVIFEATPLVGTDLTVYHRIYDALNRHVGAPFHFGLLFAEWSAPSIKTHVEDFLAGLSHDAVPVWNVSNHDQPRVASRVGEHQAQVAMALILTLPGVPTLYYGDEIGMVNGPEPEFSDDPRRNQFSRDIVRTPMQWSEDETAGFSGPGTKPWIAPNQDHKTRNVKSQFADPGSMLNFTKTLIKLRRTIPALELGQYVALDSGARDVYAFGRQLENDQITILLNFSGQAQTASVPAATPHLLLSQRKTPGIQGGTITLHPNEVCILRN